MPRFRTSRILLVSLLGLGLGLAASPSVAQAKRPTAAKKKAAKKRVPPKKKAPPVSAANKKKMQERMAGFKFGMTKEQVLATLEKNISERFDERLRATTDVSAQDRIRRDKKAELARVKKTYVTFELNKPSPWDVSIVEEEFAHGTDEAMMERWENDNGKNNRRFFFFHEAKLWKMFISLDVSILPEDKKNFDTFLGVMTSQFGPGDIGGGAIIWRMPDLEVRAVDKLKTYDAIGLSLADPRVKQSLVALREAKAPPKKQTSSIIKAVIDPDNKAAPDVSSNSDAVNAVIKAQRSK